MFDSLIPKAPRCRPKVERGFTLIEVIAATVMLGIALAAAAPPLLLSAATRIQNRRIQQANALAQQEIDRVKALLLRTEGVDRDLETGLIPPESAAAPLATTPGPDTIVATRGALDGPRDALGIDVDGDNQDDYFVQLIRNPGVRLNSGNIGQAGIFLMTVRVYDALASDNLGSLNTDPISIGLTSSISGPRTNPLVVSQAVVTQSDAGLSLRDIRIFLCEDDPTLPGCP